MKQHFQKSILEYKAFPLVLMLITLCLSLHISANENSDVNAAIKCNSIGQAQWLNGKWISQSKTHRQVEYWSGLGSELLVGKGMTIEIASGKTIFVEQLRIVSMSEDIVYWAKLPKNTLPVAFKLVNCAEKYLKFENLSHDFPQVIEYQLVAETLKVNLSSEDKKSIKLSYVKTEKQGVDGDVNNQNIVRQYVEYYQQKNIKSMAVLMAENIKWMDVNGAKLTVQAENKRELVKQLSNFFSKTTQAVTSELVSILTNGNFVSAIEKATFEENGRDSSLCSLSVYQIEENKIENVWYFQAESCTRLSQ